MSYGDQVSGMVGGDLSSGGRDDAEADFWSFAMVEERLVDAVYCWRRMDDREGRFGLSGRISSIWRQSVDDPLALIERHGMVTPEPRPLPLSRADIARMTEATEWLVHVPEQDRRIVTTALGFLASGHSQVPWRKMKQLLGIKFGADGLRKRYSRAIAAICGALNSGGKPPR